MQSLPPVCYHSPHRIPVIHFLRNVAIPQHSERPRAAFITPRFPPGYDAGVPGFDTDKASTARIYDYLAGGRDNFAADRQLARRLLELAPHARVMVRENRAFLTAAVRWVAARGVAQFIDLGSGLPTAPGIHEAAKAANPDARVAYVDNDPVVVNHLVAVASKDPVVTVIGGDLRDAEDILAVPPFDPGAPTCLVAGWVLHFFPYEIAAGLIRRYVTALASGSYLAASIGMLAGETGDRIMRLISQESTPVYRYTEDQIAALFDGLDLVEPGLVDARVWAPGVTTPEMPAARPGGSVLAAVARKPLMQGRRPVPNGSPRLSAPPGAGRAGGNERRTGSVTYLGRSCPVCPCDMAWSQSASLRAPLQDLKEPRRVPARVPHGAGLN